MSAIKRSQGVLLPIFSLSSKYGIGCFSKEAYDFVDFLKASGQSYWQILPIGPTGFGDSPYQSFSTFAGNPYFIDLDEFIDMGLLTKKECESIHFGSNDKINYSLLYENRLPLLFKAYKNSEISENAEFIKFCKNNKWLLDYSLFMALKEHFNGKPWYEWDEDIKNKTKKAESEYKNKFSEKIEFHKFLQFYFYKQWGSLKKYANDNGVKIIGDIPIYVALDSVDVWASRKLFLLDKSGTPKAVAGCPPDGFSKNGQVWGNPLYDWSYHKKHNYSWWIERISAAFTLYDVLRIDHFRGFDEFYTIPFGENTAKNGKWEKGPGIDLFYAVKKALGKKEIIAEDLGYVTDSVRKLVKDSGFYSMKILEFAFDKRDSGTASDYLPHNYNKNSVAYTGTHDNQTISAWFKSITEDERTLAREYLCDNYTPDELIYKSFISLIMKSKSKLCIVPMWDWLGLDDTARINTPSTIGTNWTWRLKHNDLSQSLQTEMLFKTKLYGRI